MTVANEITALDFVSNFLDYYEKVGIEDKLDQQTQRMITSPGVYALVQEARKLLPSRPKDGGEAQKRNEALKREQIVKQIADSPKIIDAQKRFARRTAAAGGAQGLLKEFADALTRGDNVRVGELGRHIIELNSAIETGNVPEEKN